MPAAEIPNAMQRAAELAGGQSALARALGIKPQSVQYWCENGRPPMERMLQIEAITGVPWTELRPDLAEVFTGVREAARERARESVCDLA